jgi:hypothetical protein
MEQSYFDFSSVGVVRVLDKFGESNPLPRNKLFPQLEEKLAVDAEAECFLSLPMACLGDSKRRMEEEGDQSQPSGDGSVRARTVIVVWCATSADGV